MRVAGQGTVFRIDPWGNCATAFHVFEDAFYLGGATGRETMVRQGGSNLALEVEEFGYGATGKYQSERVMQCVWNIYSAE